MVLVLGLPWAAAQPAAKPACDRACLENYIDRYLEAMDADKRRSICSPATAASRRTVSGSRSAAKASG
jgi:hypothetical protein